MVCRLFGAKPLPEPIPTYCNCIVTASRYRVSTNHVTFDDVIYMQEAWTHCDPVTPYGDMTWVNKGSDNGLLPDGTKPLPEPMLIYHQRNHMVFTWCWLTGNVHDIKHWNMLQSYIFDITSISLRGQWVKDRFRCSSSRAWSTSFALCCLLPRFGMNQLNSYMYPSRSFHWDRPNYCQHIGAKT